MAGGLSKIKAHQAQEVHVVEMLALAVQRAELAFVASVSCPRETAVNRFFAIVLAEVHHWNSPVHLFLACSLLFFRAFSLTGLFEVAYEELVKRHIFTRESAGAHIVCLLVKHGLPCGTVPVDATHSPETALDEADLAQDHVKVVVDVSRERSAQVLWPPADLPGHAFRAKVARYGAQDVRVGSREITAAQ